MHHASIDLDRLYKGYFNLKKAWCFRIYRLISENEIITLKQFEAVHDSKYFIRDQLERMTTLNIIKVTHRDPHKRKPTIFQSMLFTEDKHDTQKEKTGIPSPVIQGDIKKFAKQHHTF
jgi:hypothetical protein